MSTNLERQYTKKRNEMKNKLDECESKRIKLYKNDNKITHEINLIHQEENELEFQFLIDLLNTGNELYIVEDGGYVLNGNYYNEILLCVVRQKLIKGYERYITLNKSRSFQNSLSEINSKNYKFLDISDSYFIDRFENLMTKNKNLTELKTIKKNKSNAHYELLKTWNSWMN
jgi:hypothetical protein